MFVESEGEAGNSDGTLMFVVEDPQQPHALTLLGVYTGLERSSAEYRSMDKKGHGAICPLPALDRLQFCDVVVPTFQEFQLRMEGRGTHTFKVGTTFQETGACFNKLNDSDENMLHGTFFRQLRR